jgi:2-iminobutanoate/2-iminopropanoate deaminase
VFSRLPASVILLLAFALGVTTAAPAGAQTGPTSRRVIRPDGAPAGRPYSPGVLVGKTLYVSGQLGLPGDGAAKADMTAQTRQAMDGIGGVLKAAGLGYEHLVKCHVYLANMDDYAAMNAAYRAYFPDRVPARTTIQAATLPSGAGVEVACIGYADPAGISVVRPPPGALPAPLGPYSPAVWAGDTLYLSGMGGEDPATRAIADAAEAQVAETVAHVTATLKAAGLDHEDVIWTQAYGTRAEEARTLLTHLPNTVTAPRGVVAISRLPGPIRAELTFVAKRASARSAGTGPVYFDAATAPGGADAAAEVRAVFTTLGAQLQKASLGWQDVAFVTVYLSDIADLPKMNQVFAERFPVDPPARVTIQVQPQSGERVRIALIAAR